MPVVSADAFTGIRLLTRLTAIWTSCHRRCVPRGLFCMEIEADFFNEPANQLGPAQTHVKPRGRSIVRLRPGTIWLPLCRLESAAA